MKQRHVLATLALLSGLATATAILLLLTGSSVPVQADPGIIYVAPNGNCGGASPCYGTVQAAVDAANTGDEIRVATGTYTSTNNYGGLVQVAYVAKTVTIRGGYATTDWNLTDPISYPTTLDAQGRGRVLYITGDISPTIEGLHITGGDAAGLGGDAHGRDAGGGVSVIGAEATISGNQVFNNSAGNGGGLYLRDSTATIHGNLVYSNTASGMGGGGLYLTGGKATLNGNTFAANTTSSNGGGLCLGDPTMDINAVLSGNTIISNTADNGGGLFLVSMSPGNVTLTNNVVADNWANSSGSGLYIEGSSARMLHATIARNTGGDGSGIYVTESSLYANVSFSNTILVSHTVGVYVASGNTVTVNGILWHNTPVTVSQSSNATVMVENQHTGDPAFAADGYHLTLDSAAIDKGVDAGIDVDMDGEPRPQGSSYDLGADETGLVVRKWADPDQVQPGEPLIYTIHVANTSDVDVHAIITDALPFGIMPGQTPGGTTFVPGGQIAWTTVLTALGSAWSQTFAVTVDVGYAGPLTNAVQVTTDEGITGADISRVSVVCYNYLPLTLSNYCPAFFDDFDNPASGWDVVDDDFVRAEYVGGEYRVFSKKAGYFYLFQAPTCARQNYAVEVDARWVGKPGSGYGLIFGVTEGFAAYYLFDVNTDFQKYRLLRRDPSGFTGIVPVSDAPAINGGTATNHLRVARNGDQITLEVNGTVLGTWSDATITGLTRVGLVSSPYSDIPTSDARFDNFSVISLP